MSDYPTAHPVDAEHPPNSISVPFVIAAAVLIGVGLFAMAAFLITFTWLYFLGILPVLAGALLLFDPRSGSDRSG
ncbi:MAG: hypothetical protein L3K09_07360 [Thermoplasmata archaeon]|nr:hypothetical protein [Thermoplasmata archaeon]